MSPPESPGLSQAQRFRPREPGALSEPLSEPPIRGPFLAGAPGPAPPARAPERTCSLREEAARKMREPGKSCGGKIKDSPECLAVCGHQRCRASQQHRARCGAAPTDQSLAPGVARAVPPLWSPFALLEIVDGLLDDSAIDPTDLIRIADEQAVVTDRIDEPRDPARVLGNPGDRHIREEPEVGRPSDPGPGADVVAGLVGGQGEDAAAEADALIELAQLGAIQLVQELRLAGEHDLQQLVRMGLEVREEPDLFEGADVEILRLVEDEHRVLAGTLALDQEVVQGEEPLGVRLTGLGDAEVL